MRYTLLLSDRERATLENWAKHKDRLARRAKAVLAAARTDNVAEISRYSGLFRHAVYFWREQFRAHGLQGLAPKAIVNFSAAQHEQLAAWQNSGDERLERRAKLILEIAETQDLAAAAQHARVALNTAREWRREFGSLSVPRLPAERKRAAPVRASPDELAILSRLAQARAPYSRTATIILSLAKGESPEQVAARLDIRRKAVYNWRDRFLAAGLKGILPAPIVALSLDQRQTLEQIRTFADSYLSRRASVLLDAADRGDVAAAAKAAAVSVSRVGAWRRAFEQHGVEGLCSSRKHADPSNPRAPMAFTGRYPIELRGAVNRQEVALQGNTIWFASRSVILELNAEDHDRCVHNLTGQVFTGDIQWPVQRSDGSRVLLRIHGIAEQYDRTTIRLAISKSTFIASR